jgi:hypothetical protein
MPSMSKKRNTIKKMQKNLTVKGNSGFYNCTRNIEKGIQNSLKNSVNTWKNNMKKIMKKNKNKTRKIRRS